MSQTVPALLPEKGNLTRHRRPLYALTGLRFFAASYVVFHHTRATHILQNRGFSSAVDFFANGHLAVVLFFLLSGFILAYTYRDQIETSRDRVRFWQARFARIWPGYMFSQLVYTAVFHYIPTRGLLVACIFMVQTWNPMHLGYGSAWNGVCWTLSVEAFFYLLFPWIQDLLEKLTQRRLELLCALTFLCALFCNTAGKGIGQDAYTGIFQYVPYPIIHLPEFILGVAAGNLFLMRNAEKPLRDRGLLTYAGLVLAVIVLLLPSGRWTSAVVLGFAVLVYGLASERTWISRFLSTRALILGGGISYSIYLLQTSVRQGMDPIFAGHGFNRYLIGKLLMFPLLLLASYLAFTFIEEPARKFLRRKFAGADLKREAARASS